MNKTKIMKHLDTIRWITFTGFITSLFLPFLFLDIAVSYPNIEPPVAFLFYFTPIVLVIFIQYMFGIIWKRNQKMDTSVLTERIEKLEKRC